MTNLEKDSAPQDPNSGKNAQPVENIVVPELKFILKCGDLKHSKKVFNDLGLKIQDLVIPNGSVLREFCWKEPLYDPNAPEYAKADVTICSNGFQEYGLTVELKNGGVKIEGFDQGRPTKPYDGEIRVFLEFDLIQKVKADSLLDSALRRKNKELIVARFKDVLELEPLKLVINPDPKTLWQEKDPPADAPFQKPNNEMFAKKIDGGVVVLGASQRGRSHANDGKFREDHFAVEMGENANGWTILAVADGAGSAQFSREGARLACETMKNELSKLFSEYNVSLDQKVVEEYESRDDWEGKPQCEQEGLSRTNLYQFFYNAANTTYTAILEAAKRQQSKIKDFNTTLLCAALKHFPETESHKAFWAIASYWIGDGGLGLYRPNGFADVVALGVPDSGEFAGQTKFFTMPEELIQETFLKRMRLYFVEDFRALTLMTDGLTDPYFPAENNIADYGCWEGFFNETFSKEFSGVDDLSLSVEERGSKLLAGLGFFVSGNHDDRTILLALSDDCTMHDQPLPKPVSTPSPTEEPKEEPEQEAVTLDPIEAPVPESEVIDNVDEESVDENEKEDEPSDLIPDEDSVLLDKSETPKDKGESPEPTDEKNTEAHEQNVPEAEKNDETTENKDDNKTQDAGVGSSDPASGPGGQGNEAAQEDAADDTVASAQNVDLQKRDQDASSEP